MIAGIMRCYELARELGHTWGKLQDKDVLEIWEISTGNIDKFITVLSKVCSEKFPCGPMGIGITCPVRSKDGSYWTHITSTGRSEYSIYDDGSMHQVVRRPDGVIAVLRKETQSGVIVVVTMDARPRHLDAAHVNCLPKASVLLVLLNHGEISDPDELAHQAINRGNGKLFSVQEMYSLANRWQESDINSAASLLMHEVKHLYPDDHQAYLKAIKAVLRLQVED